MFVKHKDIELRGGSDHEDIQGSNINLFILLSHKLFINIDRFDKEFMTNELREAPQKMMVNDEIKVGSLSELNP